MIDLRYVKKLIEMLDESTVDSIEISSDKGMKIRISKSPSGRGMQVAPQQVMAPMVAGAPAPAQLMGGMYRTLSTSRRPCCKGGILLWTS